MLLKENQIEKNFLENERFEYVRANIWMLENFYSLIYEITKSSCSIIESYFPIKKEGIPVSEPISNDTVLISDPVPQSGIEPDMIFRTRMFEKFLALEQKLMNDKYLNTELHWISLHDNGKPDIKRLVVFLVGLLDNKYFLPGRDPKIKTFFESRYHIKIGQNFEPARRKEHIKEYSMVFYDYHF